MKVSTVNLSQNLDSVGPTHGTIERGEMTTGALAVLLTEFRLIDPALNLEHDPKVMVRTNAAWHAIRTERGRLSLYDARDSSQPGVEMELSDLLAALQGAPAQPAAPEITEPEILPQPGGRNFKPALAAVLLLFGLGLNAWGLHQFLQRDTAPTAALPIPIDDANRTALFREKLTGTYATGNTTGHRIIRLTRDGDIHFGVLVQNADGNRRIALGPPVKYDFGQRPNGTVCLTTAHSGQVSIGVDGSLSCYGDTYRRITTLAE